MFMISKSYCLNFFRLPPENIMPEVSEISSFKELICTCPRSNKDTPFTFASTVLMYIVSQLFDLISPGFECDNTLPFKSGDISKTTSEESL